MNWQEKIDKIYKWHNFTTQIIYVKSFTRPKYMCLGKLFI